MILRAGRLRDRITFQRKVADTSFTSAGKESWEPVATNIPAEVQDVLPSRGERLSEGMVTATRPARITIRYRADITADMRIIFGTRTLEIIGGPAVLGNRDGIELMAADYATPAGEA